MSLIEAERVTKKFGGLTALDNVSFHIGNREILGLIGPNGAGKTTLFNAVAGVFHLDEGTIRLNGEEITGLRSSQLCAKGIARTFQITKPFLNITVLENLMVGALGKERDLKKARSSSLEILEFVGLGAKRDDLAANLSLPERKKLEMARVLSTQPRLILFDEVMAGLNPTEIEEALDLIRKIHEQGITLFIVEHVMRAIMSVSHRVMVLHHGQKIAEGTPEEMGENQAVIDAYLGESYAF